MNFKSTLLAKIICLSILIVSPVLMFAVSEAAVIFLLIEPGSRPGGMGQAYVAQVEDGLSGYWNPGAMAFNRETQISFMHSNWLGDVDGIDDMYIEYLGANHYFEEYSGNLGFHAMYLTYGKQERTSENNDQLGTFTSYELALALTYAYQYSEDLGLGINFKFILSDLADEGTGQTESGVKGRGISYAFDLGLKKKNILINKLDFGLNLQNIGPNITFINEDQSDPLPMNFRMGLSYRLLESEFSTFTINTDMNKLLANDDFVLKRLFTAWYDDGGLFSSEEIESTIFNVGAEYTYYNLLSLRGGYIYDKAGSITGPSFGAGILFDLTTTTKLSIDFAMQQGGELVDYNKTFSVGLEF
ncbi:MAG: PorV/PorQ family protein [Candidatus Cloacimonetes bacterium]|jgi:hypothetical protein|nr:PorV/PorQ family protein [Candidatus Cloacimonadota bacterium]MDD4155894.1 PorV/PorQ family protein [Candidatus Cloacimonadota bacterium]